MPTYKLHYKNKFSPNILCKYLPYNDQSYNVQTYKKECKPQRSKTFTEIKCCQVNVT
jgi:hypothetical protein